jgi:hypothetical protein
MSFSPTPACPEPVRAEPTPYELYIRLNELTALWPRVPGRWDGEVVAACGFQAAELTLRLIDDALGDARAEAFPQQRIARYAEHLVDGVEITCRLLRDLTAPPPALCAATGGARSAPSPGFLVLDRLQRQQRDAITGRLMLASASLHFEIGIESQLSSIPCGARPDRLEHGGSRSDAPTMDYLGVVSPDTAYGLRAAAPFGPEDHLFSTAHQITECWLNIAHHYVAEARVCAERSEWAAAADAMGNACDVLPLAIQAGQLLDQMVLADYHPLRVRLRDGSGAQSRAARQLRPAIHAAAQVLWGALDWGNLGLLTVLQSPQQHLEPYRYLTRLKSVGKLLQSFLFHHYTLVLGVLGTHSLGSLGYEMRELAERAVQPLFPEINEAHHDYVMLSNFEHGDSSGSMVYENELAHGWNPYVVSERSSACRREIVEARVAEYFRAIQERDADAWVDLFEPTRGQLHDVPGTRPYLGQRRLKVFINGMFRAFREMRAVCRAPDISGNEASVEWKFEAVSYHGVPTLLSGREEFLFDDQGRILRAVAHWQPASVARQWQDRARDQIAEATPRRAESYVASLAPQVSRVAPAQDGISAARMR